MVLPKSSSPVCLLLLLVLLLLQVIWLYFLQQLQLGLLLRPWLLLSLPRRPCRGLPCLVQGWERV